MALVACAGAAERARCESPEVVEVRWAGPESGNWLDADLWAGGVSPNNTDLVSYDVVFDSLGEAHTISLWNDVTVRRIRLESVDAALEQSGGTLTLTDGMEISAGRFRFIGGTIRGSIQLSGGAFDIVGDALKVFDGVVFGGGDLVLGAQAQLRAVNGLHVTDGDVVLSANSSVLEFTGTQTMSGFDVRVADFTSGTLRVGTNAELTLGEDSVFHGGGGNGRLQIGVNATLRNLGAIVSARILDPLIPGGVAQGNFHNQGLMTGGFARVKLWLNEGALEGLSELTGDGTNSGVLRNVANINGDWINTGLLEVASGSSTVSGALTHDGTARVLSGGELRMLTVVGGQGGFELRGGLLSLSGAFGSSYLDRVDAQGGVLAIEGDWDNTGRVYTPPAGADEFRLWRNAVVRGGELHVADTSQVSVQSVTFDDVRLSGEDLWVNTGRTLTLLSGLTTDANALVVRRGGRVVLASDTLLASANIRLEHDGPGSNEPRLELTGTNALVIDAHSSITGAGFVGMDSLAMFGRKIYNHGVVTANDPVFGLSLGASFGLEGIENYGTMSAANGASLSIAGLSVFNTGLIEAALGSTVTIHTDHFVNTGMVVADGATARFRTHLSNVDFQRIRAVGGEIEMVNDWSLGGETIMLDSSHGALAFSGLVDNGRFELSGGAELRGKGSASLRDVTVSGGDVVLVDEDARLRLLEGVHIEGGSFRLQGANSLLRIENPGDDGENVLNAKRVVFDGVGSPPSGWRFLYAGISPAGRTLVIDAQSTVTGVGGMVGRSVLSTDSRQDAVINYGLIDAFANQIGAIEVHADTLMNHGLIRAGGAAEQNRLRHVGMSMVNTGEVRAHSNGVVSLEAGLVNHGLVVAHAGGTINIFGGGFENLGMIRTEGGVVTISAPAITAAQLGDIRQVSGTVLLGGKLENTGGELRLNEQTGSWLLSAWIAGGQVVYEDGLTLRLGGSSRLEDVSIIGSAGVSQASGILRLRGAVDFGGATIAWSGGASTVEMETDTHLKGVTMLGASPAAPLRVTTAGIRSLRIDAQSALRGSVELIHGSSTGRFAVLNEGLLEFSRPGETLLINSVALTNPGVIEVGPSTRLRLVSSAWEDIVDGTLTQGTIRVLHGASLDLSLSSLPGITRNAADLSVYGALNQLGFIHGLGENMGRIAVHDGAWQSFSGVAPGESVFVNRGEIHAGRSAIVIVSQGFRAESESSLGIELAGETGDPLAGRYLFLGEAQLAGELRVVLSSDFAAQVGDVWSVLTADGVSGVFDSLSVESGMRGFRFEIAYTATTVELLVVPSSGSMALLAMFGALGVRRRR